MLQDSRSVRRVCRFIGLLAVIEFGCEHVNDSPPPPAPQQVAQPRAASRSDGDSEEAPRRTDREAIAEIEKREEHIGVVKSFVGSVPGQRRDALLESLAEVPAELFTIRELDLSGSPVTEAGLMYLSRMPLVEAIDVSHLTFSETVLTGLRELPRLRKLTMLKARFPTGPSLAVIGQLPHLEQLTLTETLITDADLTGLRDMPHLRELHLDATPLTDAAFEHLATLTRLEVLTISQAAITSRGLQKLCGSAGSQLRILDVHQTAAGRNGFAALSGLPALEELDASQAQVGDDSLRGWRSPPKLRKLVLAKNAFTNVSLPGILSSPDLEELNFQKVPGISDQGLNLLVKKLSLRMLQLDQTGVTLQSAQKLKQMMPETRVGIAGTIY